MGATSRSAAGSGPAKPHTGPLSLETASRCGPADLCRWVLRRTLSDISVRWCSTQEPIGSSCAPTATRASRSTCRSLPRVITYRSALKAVSAAPAPQAPASTDAARPAYDDLHDSRVLRRQPPSAGAVFPPDATKAELSCLPRAPERATRYPYRAKETFHGRRSGTARLPLQTFRGATS